ncbi:helix-turn-helix domain-containing protein [Streptomyces geranii]|uniref:helix-turn-helix domain-containing protein n=1 Tax=Streptomyces geranii TaxID=2058923 RepID=UPI000D02AE31|nr:helix-turn-helix domain-containing protein [Streptomyces geranii]
MTDILDDEHRPALAPKLLTVREAYRRLRISKWKLYDLIRSRRLVSIKIGRRRLIPAEAVENMIRQLSREAFA